MKKTITINLDSRLLRKQIRFATERMAAMDNRDNRALQEGILNTLEFLYDQCELFKEKQ